MRKKVLMACVGKEVELLGLPGMKPFPVVADALVTPRWVHLFRKYSRITRDIEGLVCHHGGRLMVAVVLPPRSQASR